MLLEVFMFSENQNTFSVQQRLLNGLAGLPADWSLTPVGGDKKPYLKNWQKQPQEREIITNNIKSGRAKGFALICGELSNGLLAVDADGEAAHELLTKLGDLPKTVAFTSGKQGRCQYLLRIPQEYWSVFNTVKLDTKVKDKDGKPQLLEFRWSGCASVLPPSVHPETGEYKWVMKFDECEIAEVPTWVIELMLNQTPRQSPQQSYSEIQLPVPERVPLIECLSKEARSILNNNDVTKGGRNDTAAMLARDLIGTANYLERIGQQFDGEPYQILCDWCSAVGLHEDKPKNQFEQIWFAAEQSNPCPSCSEEGVNNCIRGWYWRTFIKTTTGNKVVRHPAAKTITANELLTQIEDLVAQELPKKHLYIKLAEIAKSTGFTERLIERIYSECLKESQNLELQESMLTAVDKLVNASQHRFDIANALPVSLANPIKQLASDLNLRPEVYFTALLATASSLHNAQTRIRLINKTDFELTPNIFAATVAQSSQKKTPIYKAMVTKPLAVLQQKIEAEYQQQLVEYIEQLEEYESLDKKERKEQFPNGEPKKPALRLLWFNQTTGEGLLTQVQNFPDKGILWAADELAGVFKSENQYRYGKGNDEENLLGFYNGDGVISLRASGVRNNIKSLLLGVFGSIQPDILSKLMSDCKDSNGKWARFLYVMQPKSGCEILEDSFSPELTPIIANLYERIDNLLPQKYELTPAAKGYFLKCYNALEQKYEETSHPGLSNIYGKAAGYIGKIALNLHVIKYAFNGEETPPLIDLETMKAAVNVTSFYLSQALLLYSQFSSEDSLPYHLSRVITLCQKNVDYLWSAREIAKGFPSKVNLDGTQIKLSCDIIRNWFQELERMGKGVIHGIGNKLKFSLFNKTAESAEPVPNDIRQSQTIDITSVEELVPKCRQPKPPSDVPSEIDIDTGEDDLPSEINGYSKSVNESANRQIACDEVIPTPSDVEHNSAEHSTNRQNESSEVTGNSSNPLNEQKFNALNTLLDYLAPLPNFKKGDKCQYVGSNPCLQQQYGNQQLEVSDINYRRFACRTESGDLTTWLYPQDLRKI
jgi:Protein of unknown function (DUF3987)/Bifunctional DNA primase/polymerase, N-terminal